MSRLSLFRASFFLLCAVPLAAQPAPPAPASAGIALAGTPSAITPTPVPPPPAPRIEDLTDVRTQVARGKYGDAAVLAERVTANYTKIRDQQTVHDRHWVLDSCMVGYCLFTKAQILALKGDAIGAQQALDQGDAYHAQHPETQFPSMTSIWQELDATTQGLILEAKGDILELSGMGKVLAAKNCTYG